MKFNFLKATFAGLVLTASCFFNVANAGLMTFDGDPNTWDTVYDTSEVDVIFQSAKYSWGSGYNDLTNAAYTDKLENLIIDFVALGGATVTLNSFDLGNYVGRNYATQYQIFDLSDIVTPLISTGSFVVPYSTTNHPTYAVGLSSTLGIRLQLGPDLYNNGLDNVNFIASVPEPSTLAIFALGMIGLASGRFKKQS